MWTMECNDHSHGSATLRPLLPRPICTTTTTTTTTKSSLFSTIPDSSCFCVRNPSFHSWKHPLLGEVSNDYRKRVMHSVPLVSTRWNPTPEQLQALEEMYKRGTRTPTSQQIQQIAAKLRRFGKIEGKNVFYWFQNHKARERQKKRRQVELQAAAETKKRQQVLQAKVEKKPTGLGTRYFDIEHPTKTLPSLSSSSTLSEGAECNKKEGWKLQQKQHVITREKNETCWKLELSTCNTAETITTQRTRGQESAELDHRLLMLLPSNNINDFNIIESGIKPTTTTQTLQLFPVGCIQELNNQDASMGGGGGGIKLAATNEFIEFLPTKK